MIIERESRNRLFGIVDVDQAAVSGYLPAWVLVSNKQDREKALGRGEFSESSTAQEFVRTGLKPGDGPDDQTASPGEIDGKEVPPNGCVGQAREQVYETNTIMARFTFGQDLHLSVWDEAAVDPRTVAVDKKWQTCMADAGFQMGAKWDWDDRFTGIPETERPTEEERRQAVADATCNLEVGYADTFYDVLVELQEAAIEDNQLALTEERAEIDEALARANELMKGR